MVIDKNHPALQGNPEDFIKDEIDNLKIRAFEINKAIVFLTKNKYSRYTIDTGQDNMTVQYQDLASLDEMYSKTIELIAELENQNTDHPSAFIARPI